MPTSCLAAADQIRVGEGDETRDRNMLDNCMWPVFRGIIGLEASLLDRAAIQKSLIQIIRLVWDALPADASLADFKFSDAQAACTNHLVQLHMGPLLRLHEIKKDGNTEDEIRNLLFGKMEPARTLVDADAGESCQHGCTMEALLYYPIPG